MVNNGGLLAVSKPGTISFTKIQTAYVLKELKNHKLLYTYMHPALPF
jgi:hypothetical protein